MQKEVNQLAARAVHAADAVQDLIDEAQAITVMIAPPIEVHALAYVLGRWADRLQDAGQPATSQLDQPEPGNGK
jgi:hypothetical protein